mgnify:CR=1 FL=1
MPTSTTVKASEDGTLVSEIKYTAFGEVRSLNGVLVTDNRYTSQREDSYINMYWYTTRWYDPALAHFNQPEIIVPDPNNAQDWDRFSYVNNSPINYSDPSGHMRSDEDSSSENTSGNLTTYQKELLNNEYYYEKSRKENQECGNGKCPGWMPYSEIVINTFGGLVLVGGASSFVANVGGVTFGEVVTDSGTLLCLDGDCTNEVSSAATTYVDDIISFGEKTLRHTFDRHGSQWGYENQWTRVVSEQFKQTLIDHINSPETQQILGFYRGKTESINFFDPNTGLNVITNLSGELLAAWKLSSQQIMNLYLSANIQ